MPHNEFVKKHWSTSTFVLFLYQNIFYISISSWMLKFSTFLFGMNLCAKALSWLCTSTWNHNCINTKRQTHIILCTKPTIEGRCGLAEQIKYSPEYHFHVPGGAPAPHPPLHVPLARRGDEVVTLTRLELHLHWRWRERSASDKLFTELFTTIVIVKYCFKL